MMNDLETLDETGSQDAGVHSSARSLAISPDLNALLEHDERTRDSDTAFPVGLPPPPRKAKSRPTSQKQTENVGSRSTRRSDASPWSSDPSAKMSANSNPFINAPPKLPQSYGSKEQEQSVSDLSSTPEMPHALQKIQDDLPPSTTAPERHRDIFHSFRLYTSSSTTVRQNSASLRPTEQPSNVPFLASHSMPRVERLFGKGKNMFSTSGSHSQGNSPAVLNEEAETTEFSGVQDRGNMRGFSELSNQLGPSSETRQTTDHDQTQNHHGLFTNEGGDTAIPSASTSRPNEEPNKPTRPILFHDSHSWEPSRTRSGSYSFESTQSPTTALEPRISISTTRYPLSYSESLSQSSRPPDPVSPYSSGKRGTLSSASPGHRSFIDLFSSPSPEFSDHSPTSPLAGESRPLLSTLKSRTTRRSFSDDRSPVSLHLPKPPIPNTPKPTFRRYSSTHPPPDKNQYKPSTSSMYHLPRQPSPKTTQESQGSVPPTTNFLNADERADLVKKSRKLAQVFGATPKASVISQKHDKLQPDSVALPSLLPMGRGKGRHVHGAVSVSGIFKTPTPDNRSNSVWPPPEGTLYMTASGRRHSAPFSPDKFPFLHDYASGDSESGIIDVGSQEGVANNDCSSNQASNLKGPDSPASFMDLSDEDADSISASETARKRKDLALPLSPSTPSLAEPLTPGEQEEADRKRKRDKLAKLHRFLGSRVPIQLVLGLGDGELTSPAPQSQEDHATKLDAVSEHGDHRKAWLTRRRSSSAAVYSDRSHDLERLKEDLNDEEKAIHVRRAQKMEKVFGVPPPQTLYTRHSVTTPSGSPVRPSSGRFVTPAASQTGSPSPVGQVRNPNQSAYKAKKTYDPPGSPESAQQLIPSRTSAISDINFQRPNSLDIPDVYTHYQHSLHSLNDIIDRDDRASLVELHQYLQGEGLSSPLLEFAWAPSSTSIKSERRRSLPSSIISVSTADYSLPTPKPEPTDFQLRRRRAAKLTQFFGVDYKQIIHDILESIEKGVEEDRKKGTLQPEEAEALLRKLRTLKTKRSGIP